MIGRIYLENISIRNGTETNIERGLPNGYMSIMIDAGMCGVDPDIWRAIPIFTHCLIFSVFFFVFFKFFLGVLTIPNPCNLPPS